MENEENEKMEQEVKELTERLNAMREEQKSLHEGMTILAEQNKKADVPVVSKEEFQTYQQESREQIENTILEFSKTASEYITEKFKDQEKVTGQEVIDAVAESWK